MKVKKAKVFFALAAVTAVMLSLMLAASLTPAPTKSVVVEAAMPDVPSHVYVLKKVGTQVTAEKALNIAKVFNVTGTPSTRYDLLKGIYEKFNITEKEYNETCEELRLPPVWTVGDCYSRQVFVRSGAVYFNDWSKLLPSSGLEFAWRAEEAPSKGECVARATQFIEKLKAAGLTPPEGTELVLKDDAEGSTYGVATNETVNCWIFSIPVRFEIRYNGLEVNTVSVSVGKGEDDLEIVRFEGPLFATEALEPVEKVPILSPRQALSKLESWNWYPPDQPKLTMPIPKNKTAVTVKSIRLEYGGESGSDYLKPEYEVELRVEGRVPFQTEPYVVEYPVWMPAMATEDRW